jgi:hypothetical protein
MECTHCGAGAQRGRFCVGCGRRMPPSLQPMRPVRLAPRPAENADARVAAPVDLDVDLDLTQPVLRLQRIPRPRVPRAAVSG